MVTIIKHDFLYPSHILKLLCYIFYLECTETQTETHDIRWECFLKNFCIEKRKGKEKIQMYKHWARPVDKAVNSTRNKKAYYYTD